MPKTEKSKKTIETSQMENRINELKSIIEHKRKQYQEMKEGCLCFPFLGVGISRSVVDDVFQELRTNFRDCKGHLNVIVDSGGGDIDAAYNLSMLFRKYGTNELSFIIPRWAKSAATLLVCSGDKIFDVANCRTWTVGSPDHSNEPFGKPA